MLLIAHTAYGDDEHRRQAEEAGFDRLVRKPYDPIVLAGLLRGAPP